MVFSGPDLGRTEQHPIFRIEQHAVRLFSWIIWGKNGNWAISWTELTRKGQTGLQMKQNKFGNCCVISLFPCWLYLSACLPFAKRSHCAWSLQLQTGSLFVYMASIYLSKTLDVLIQRTKNLKAFSVSTQKLES